MTRIARAASLLLAALAVGCSDQKISTSDAGTPPPHSGRIINLPGGRGYLEVVTKPQADPKNSTPGEATFYFLKDMKTPFSPAPTTGTLAFGKKIINLQQEGEGLTTPGGGPALFAKENLDGVLSVSLDGKDVNIPLGVRE